MSWTGLLGLALALAVAGCDWQRNNPADPNGTAYEIPDIGVDKASPPDAPLVDTHDVGADAILDAGPDAPLDTSPPDAPLLDSAPDAPLPDAAPDALPDSSADLPPDAASSDSTVPTCTWSVVNTGLSFYTAQLMAIWGTSSSDLFITGDNGVILHFDGKTWSKHTLSAHKSSHIRGVMGFGGKTFATGRGAGGANDGVIYEYKGAGQWQAVHTCSEELNSLWAYSAAGWVAPGDSGTIVYDSGSGWTTFKTATGASLSRGHYRAVWGKSASEIYISESDLIDAWDFSSGSPKHTKAHIFPGGTLLNGVWGFPSMVYASGGNLLWYKSASGSMFSSMSTNCGTACNSIWGLGPGDLYAPAWSGVMHYDGANWTKIMSAVSKPSTRVYGFGTNDLWAVGSKGEIQRCK